MAAASPIISLVAAGLTLVGVLFAYLGVVSPMAGFQTFVAGALMGGILSTLLALVGLFLSRGGRDPEGWMRSLIGLSIGLGLLIVVLLAAAPGREFPPINDITTDLANPPAFADASVIGEFAERDMSYPAEFVEIVRDSYPDLAPVRLAIAPADAFQRSRKAAEGLGWEIIEANGGAGTINARESTAIFRFVDDIVIRVAPEAGDSVIDIRSKSRDGRGDLGANATRIRAFIDALEANN